MEKKKILIVSQFYIPDITAAAYRMNDMVEAINDLFEMDVVTSYPHKSDAAVESAERNIYRVHIASKSKIRLLRYLNEYFGFMIKAIFLSGKLKDKYDYVFVTSPPIFTMISGFLLARLKKAKLIIDIRDLWPDVLLDDRTLKERSFVYRALKEFELFMYGHADYITCVSRRMKDYIRNLAGKDATVIYNGVSENGAYLANPDRKKQDKQNLFYTGNIGYFQHLDVLVSCFQKYPRLFELFDVHILGGGTELPRFRDLARINCTENIIFYGPVNKTDTVRLTATYADVLFLNLHNSKTLEKTIPSKLFDYLYFNLPILYGILGEGKEILDELRCGMSFQWNDEESLYYALMEIHGNYDLYLDRSKGNHDFVLGRFDRRKMFYEFWRDLCG